MGDLILNSLEVRGFRRFEHLQIERLGRVNLIVGKNNVGKTSLLEVLQLYAHRGSPTLILEQLRGHDESKPLSSRYGDAEELLSALKYLFHGRPEPRAHLDPIAIGPANSSDTTLSIAVDWWYTIQISDGIRTMQPLESTDNDKAVNRVPRFTVQMGKQTIFNYLLDSSLFPMLPRSLVPDLTDINCIFVTANGLSKEQAAELWDSIALTEQEKEVLAALRLIAPGITGLSFVGDSTSRGERSPIVKIASIHEPLPLRSLGDGMQRVLGIALALVNTRDGLLLIDEFENGLHYSAQPDLWRLIFRVASQLNVQVFAATHSWDCLRAFQEAAQEDAQNEGLLIRLESKKGKIVPTLFDERKLGIATREQIEVR